MRKDRTGFGDSPGDQNILVAHDEDHARIRKLLSHATSDAALRKQEPLIISHHENLLSKLRERVHGPDNGVVDLTYWFTFTAFDVIGDLSCGSSFEAINSGGFHSWVENLFTSIKFLGILRVAETYKWVGALLNWMMETFPALQKSRDLHIKLTRDKTVGRMQSAPEREDFLTHVSWHAPSGGHADRRYLGPEIPLRRPSLHERKRNHPNLRIPDRRGHRNGRNGYVRRHVPHAQPPARACTFTPRNSRRLPDR